MWSFFRQKKKEAPQTVGEVLMIYGELLEKHPLSIMDISTLPASKTKMKALLKALYAKSQSSDERNFCEAGFMFLSKFQDGVGDKPIDSPPLPGTSKADLEAGVAALEKWMGWEKLSLVESEVLMAEWKRFQQGEPI